MILGRILELLAARQSASLAEIAQALDADPEAVRAMLQLLQRKGRVQRLSLQAGCGSSCTRCAPALTEIYVSADASPAATRTGAADRRQQKKLCPR